MARGEPLWRRLAELDPGAKPVLPVPMVNILSGGLHAGRNIEFQDFLAIGHGLPTFRDALAAVVAVHRATREILTELGAEVTGVADEGGWGPRLESNETALAILTEAIGRAGFDPGREVSIALDVAATHFHQQGWYELKTEGRLNARKMTELLAGWCERYPVRSIEDPLEEDDWEGWALATGRLGGQLQIVGDDLFTTNATRVREGVARKAGNAVLIKMNQIGTLTETFEVLRLARSAGYRTVVSARSGETEDSFLADLAVASGAGQIKVGSITRSERLAKYNRLLAIERDAGLTYPSSPAFPS
jgi:enolase